MTPKQIAEVCHEANRAVTAAISDVPLQPHWHEAPDEMIHSTIRGVEWRLANPDAPASAQHEKWMADKIADGWVWGETKDAEKKTHPALIPYEKLGPDIQSKDAVFTAIVLALAP